MIRRIKNYSNGNKPHPRLNVIIFSIVLFSYFLPFDTFSQGLITRSNDLRIGDFYYSDGTTSHVQNDNKECIGIVFSLNTSQEEKRLGFTHGYIVAMNDCDGGTQVNWGKNIDLPDPHKNIDYVEDFIYDKNGYIYNFMGKFDRSNPAYILAKNYEVSLPLNKTSGWYLPSVGQWYDILSNLGELQLQNHFYFNGSKIKQSLQRKGLNISGNSYLTSTERDKSMTWIVDFGENPGGFYSPWNSKKTKHRVRAVAAF